MSIYDYTQSKSFCASVPKPTFTAYMMAAARRASREEFALLCKIFPDITNELIMRDTAPGGLLVDDVRDMPRDHPARIFYVKAGKLK